MASRKKNLPLLEAVEITAIAGEGKSLAKLDNMVVFTQYAVPGDIVDLQITKKKHNYMEGRVVRFVKYSDRRANPFCSHYGVCGGCKWQILPYEDQIKQKQQQVEDCLTRIGKVELPAISPILGSAKTMYYRNKLEFSFSNKRWLTSEQINSGESYDDMNALGFHIPRH